jgi:hypothetical protein
MDLQIKQAMEALTKAGEGVWDEVRSQGADAAMGLVQDMRESHVDMVIDLSQQVGLMMMNEKLINSSETLYPV